MARELDPTRTRIVFDGSESSINSCVCEYAVVLGELSEPPKRIEIESPNFSAQSNSFWTSIMAIVSNAENI